ncbi:MAG: glycosyltransferase family 2 protein [Pseudomonadota bacterium]
MAKAAVLIAVYNGADFIADAVKSALNQTIEPEVIVVDDCSTDATVAIAEAAGAGSSRLTVVRQPVNQGPGAARNRALDLATADWVTVLDADDRMAPDRLERLFAFAESGGWDMVADDIKRVTDWSALHNYRRQWREQDIGEIDVSFEFFVRENHRDICGEARELGFLKPLMRRSALEASGLRYNEAMRLGEDYDLYARALLEGQRFLVVDPLGYFAFDTPGSLSKSHSVSALEQVYRADQTLLDHPAITPAGRKAVLAHRQLTHRKWAWARLIEAVGERNLKEAALCFLAPPHVIGVLVSGVFDHFFDPNHPRRAKPASAP